MRPLTVISILLALTSLSVLAQVQKPNIVLILTDDLGYGDLSCYGATDLQTPNIDELASTGLKFTQFYANSPVCSPSRASLLTGQYPDHVGVPGVIRQWEQESWGYFKEDVITLPQALKQAGYHTGMVGKWHLGFKEPQTPNARGFDEFKGFLGDMMDDYWTHLRGEVNWMRHNHEEINPEGHATELFTQWAVDYVDTQKDKDQPFFLYLAYNAPHFPIQPPEDYFQKVLQRENGIDRKRARNVAFVEHLDHEIGKLMAYLRQEGLMENTLIIFTSDNGGALRFAQSNGKLKGSKQQMFEGGIRVPTIVFWKDQIAAGTQSDHVGMLMDILPTLCDIGELEIAPEVDGISLLPTLMGEPQDTDDRYLYWVRREGWHYGGQAYYGARWRDFKILQNSAYEPLEFYNIGQDPYETTPLEAQDHVEYDSLRSALRQHIRQSGGIPWQSQK